MRGDRVTKRFAIAVLTRLALLLSIGAASLAHAPAAEAQILPQSGAGAAAAVEIPDELTPEIIDGMLARLTDAEIRGLLRGELIRRAEAEADEAPHFMALERIEARLDEMTAEIASRFARWAVAFRDIGDRLPEFRARVGSAEAGAPGMVLAAAALVAFGVIASMATIRAARPWRDWLRAPERGGYWDLVVRSIALGVIEFLPIVVFVAVTRAAAPFLSDRLGPLVAYVWIYHVGVSYSWLFIVVMRRAFAPDAPQIRIAPLSDHAAIRLHRLLRRAAQIGAAGWLLGGFSPTLGFGFPPAIVAVALSGTAVAALLLIALIRNFHAIREATAVVVSPKADKEPGAFARIAVIAAPVLLGVYIVCAWVWWAAHWLERGDHRLYGPVGTLLIYLSLPIFDRLGRELVQTIISSDMDAAARFRSVFHGAWRMLIGVVATLIVADFWGLDVLGFAKGANALPWADTAFDIVATLLVGWLIWRLIRAALHSERRVSSASEDVDPSESPSASRLYTLTPLFRNVLLAFLATVILMIILASLGVDIGPLIASAGIIGIALGFGAQTLVRDVLSGVFFLIDDAFRVGEYIELDPDLRGEVENISVRSLQLRHHRGPVITIPFGELKNITNHNRDWVLYKMPMRLEPNTDPQHVKKVVKKVGAEFMEHPDHGPKFLEPPKSQGVYYVDDDSALVFRVKFKCKPRAQFVLRRELYHRLREVFEAEGIRFARRKVEVVGAEGRKVSEEDAAAAIPEEVAGASPKTVAG